MPSGSNEMINELAEEFYYELLRQGLPEDSAGRIASDYQAGLERKVRRYTRVVRRRS